MTYPFANLAGNLAAFCDLLRRDYGFRTGPRELQDAARALEIVELGSRRAVCHVLRPVLAGRVEDARVFDAAFDRFFGAAAGAPPPRDHPARPHQPPPSRKSGAPARDGRDLMNGEDAGREEKAIDAGRVQHADPAGTEPDAPHGLLRTQASPIDAEGAMALLDPVDRAWRDAASRFISHLHAGLSRRWQPSRQGQRFDLRRTLRTSLHTGGEVVMPRWRSRPRRRPRIVMFIDGSRSMEPYVRPSLQMAVALAAVTLNAETFAFSTALRRVTRDVRRAAGGESRPLRLEHAWGGGTTIGACLREFLRSHGDRLLGRDTIVVMASDGLEIGDPRVLRDALAQISRRSAAIVWINPLLETPGYQPTALGMSAARPYVTALASVKDAATLSRLAGTLRLR